MRLSCLQGEYDELKENESENFEKAYYGDFSLKPPATYQYSIDHRNHSLHPHNKKAAHDSTSQAAQSIMVRRGLEPRRP